jgi:hypothetical protein
MEILPRESNLASPVTEALIRLGPGSVPGLVQALEDKNARFQALHTLGRLGPIALEAAPAMLKASQAEYASEGMLAIAMLGQGAVPTLVEGAQDATRAMHALRALASLKERAAGATKALSDLLLANDYPEKAEVLRTLAGIGPDAKPAGTTITAMLKDPSEEIQAAAALALVMVLEDGKTAAPVLHKLVVEAKNPQARRDAALALARIPTEATKSLPLLRPLLTDSQAVLRVAGAQALGLLGKDALPALPDLIKATADAAPEVQEATCQALANLGADAAVEGTPALVALLKPGIPEKVQLAALLALGKWGTGAKSAGPALRSHLTALRENDLTTGELQVQTARALWKAEGKAALSVVRETVVRQLKTQTYPPALAEALTLIGEVGPDLGDLAPMLATRVDSAYQVIRQGSIRALGQIGPAASSALPWLQRAASQETDPALRQQAKDAIAAIQKG